MADLELESILQQTVQARATEEPLEGGGRVDVFSWLNRAGGLIAPWWSKTRDRQLRSFWKQNDCLASAMYTLQEKITSVPFHVEPVDPSVRSHIRQAEEYEENLRSMTGFGAGWVQGIKPFVEDLFGQDNGGFLEVIAGGPKDKPIRGAALGLAHMDARCCVRTRSPEFPVYYYDPVDGGRYKFHHTRVICASQMPSPDVWMNSVGYSAVSRSINAAQNLYDIATYKMEKLGSRPKRQILIAKKGLTTNDVILAMKTADESMDNEGLTRASKTVVIGPARATANTEIALEQIDLASAPDGFSEQESVTIGVYILAWAWGVDAREFWPATSAGATKADAMVQHMKARGKAVGNTFALLELLVNGKFLPSYLKLRFDVQDDDEDQQRSAIEEARSATIDRDLKGKVYDVRTARRKMVDEGHLSEESYIENELTDGRLEGGEDVLTLFYSDDPLVKDLLDLGVDDPLDKEECEWEAPPIIQVRPKPVVEKPIVPIVEKVPTAPVAA